MKKYILYGMALALASSNGLAQQNAPLAPPHIPDPSAPLKSVPTDPAIVGIPRIPIGGTIHQANQVTAKLGASLDFNQRIQEFMGKVDVVAIGEYTGEYKEHMPFSSASGFTYEYFFKPIQTLKGAPPKSAINIMHGFGPSFPKPANLAGLYHKGARYLLLLETMSNNLPDADKDNPRPRTYYSLPQPNLIVQLEE